MSEWSWNQPICNLCWQEKNPERNPYRLKTALTKEETCAYCGNKTRSGIYVRDDPANVEFKQKRED